LPSISKYIKKRYYQCIISKKVRTIRSQSRTAYSVNMNIYQFICTGIAKLKSQSKNKSLSQIRFLSLTTFHFISHTIHLLANNFLGFATTFLLKGSTLRLGSSNIRLRSTNIRLRGTTLRLGGTNIRLRGQTLKLRGQTLRLKGPNIRLKGPTLRLGGATLRLEATRRRFWVIEGKTYGLTVPLKVFNIKLYLKHLLSQQIVVLLRIPKHKGTIFRQSLKVSNYSIG